MFSKAHKYAKHLLQYTRVYKYAIWKDTHQSEGGGQLWEGGWDRSEGRGDFSLLSFILNYGKGGSILGLLVQLELDVKTPEL